MSTDLIPADTSLDVDPVQHMSVVLNRAKGWLDEARSIDDVRQAKALAVGYESVIREKELAFDAQLAATELVRRCERRIGELVREGQEEGSVLRRGQTLAKMAGATPHLQTVTEAFGVGQNSKDVVAQHYTMADVPAERFEQAITEAREEGNLSRANVVRKVKGETPKPERSEWHHKRSRIDSNRILMTLAQELDAATSGLDLMEVDGLDPELVADYIPAIRQSIAIINRHLRRITS